MYTYACIIERIVDGDTVDVSIDLGFDVWTRQRVRVASINTPEIRGRERAEGLKAKARVEELIPEGSQQTLQTEIDGRGKYGRVLGRFLMPDGRHLGDILLEEGLARPYR